MMNEITENNLIDFCNDLEFLFEKYQMCIKHHYISGFYVDLIQFNNHKLIDDIKDNFYC